MGRFISIRRRRAGSTAPAATTNSGEWYEHVLQMASAQGAMPYVVEGFVEIYEAVRRGHSVLLKREECTVAEGVTVFAERPEDAPPEATMAADPVGWFRRVGSSMVVTVARFDPRTARFVLQDAASAVGSLELTPKRLQRYVDHPGREVGVALGA